MSESELVEHDPQDLAEWQHAVDAARVFLLIDAAEQYGLITGPTVRTERCAEIIERGAALGINPRDDDTILAEMLQ